MRLITDDMLIESYCKALDLQLETEFIELLLEEITRRRLNLEYYHTAQVC